jgi:hypothetical protein
MTHRAQWGCTRHPVIQQGGVQIDMQQGRGVPACSLQQAA